MQVGCPSGSNITRNDFAAGFPDAGTMRGMCGYPKNAFPQTDQNVDRPRCSAGGLRMPLERSPSTDGSTSSRDTYFNNNTFLLSVKLPACNR
jgi:hypothetical protein